MIGAHAGTYPGIRQITINGESYDKIEYLQELKSSCEDAIDEIRAVIEMIQPYDEIEDQSYTLEDVADSINKVLEECEEQLETIFKREEDAARRDYERC